MIPTPDPCTLRPLALLSGRGTCSYVGITPSEAADLKADSLIQVDLRPAEWPHASLPHRFAARRGVKRSIGRTVYEHFLNQTLLQFEACSVRTLSTR